MQILPEICAASPALDRGTEGLACEIMGKPGRSMAHRVDREEGS